MYQFTSYVGDVESLIIESFPASMFLPSSDDTKIELFNNGDRMTIDLANKTMAFDGVDPTRVTSSRLNHKRHMWLSKGMIRPVEA